ncbi:hypothetical protein RUM43_010165, partial [Polyplax serrata]
MAPPSPEPLDASTERKRAKRFTGLDIRRAKKVLWKKKKKKKKKGKCRRIGEAFYSSYRSGCNSILDAICLGPRSLECPILQGPRREPP